MSDVALETQEDVRAAVVALVSRVGVVRAARGLGVGREAVIRIVAGIGVRPGTYALVRERLSARPQAA